MDFYQSQLKHQIEDSPFSEEFTLLDTQETVRGIFDESNVIDAGQRSTRRNARIIVFDAPVFTAGITKIIVREKEYVIQKHERDANMGSLLYLT